MQECCQHCGQAVSVDQIFDPSVCPHCYEDLSESIYEQNVSDSVLIKQERLALAWINLIKDHSLSLKEDKEIGLRLLFIVNNKKPMYHRTDLERALASYNLRLDYILQFIRGTLKPHRKIHLNKILNILCDQNISLAEFTNIVVPDIFRDSVIKSKLRKAEIVCLAPWCISYMSDKSIVKTGTLSKVYEDGTYLKGHVACLDCGCEYGLDREGKVKEKSYYAQGYRFLQGVKPSSLAEFQRTSGFTLNACWRINIYFQARGLFNDNLDQVKVDEKLLGTFAEGLNNNFRLTDIQKWPCWESKNHYLIHRLHPDIMRRLIQLKRPAIERLSKHECWKKIIQCCEEFLLTDVTITIENIAGGIGITSATLSKWGYTIYIKEMKEKQKILRLEKERINGTK